MLLAVVALAMIMIPVTKWYLSMSSNTDNLAEKLEMQSVIQDKWNQINAATYDEFQTAIATKGKTWTETVGDKWDITIKFSEDGKYENAGCSVGMAAGATDRHCRKAEITIVSKTDSNLAQGIETTKISMPAESSTINDLKNRMTAAEDKFGSYVTTSSLNSKLGSYVTTSEMNSKFGNYYTATQVDSKISSSGSGYSGWIQARGGWSGSYQIKVSAGKIISVSYNEHAFD